MLYCFDRDTDERYSITKAEAERNVELIIQKEKLRLGFKIRGQVINDMMEKKLKTAPTEYSTEDALRESRIPVLFIHGTSDRLVPVEMTYKNYLACKAPKELLIVPGADHGLSYFVDKDRCAAAVRSFFDKYDKEPEHTDILKSGVREHTEETPALECEVTATKEAVEE